MAAPRESESRVTAAMSRIERAGFLPASQRGYAAADHPLPIGHGQTNSQPTTVRQMLVLLDVRPGQHVLDVGCGSAWSTALLADLVGPDGDVVGVEIVPELVEWGGENLTGNVAEGAGRARVVQAAPGVLGWPEEAPYDRILVSAEARTVPEALVDQLAVDGVMVVPVRGRMLRVSRRPGKDTPVVERHGHYRFVPLVDA